MRSCLNSKKNVETAPQESGCCDFRFAVDVNNPNVVLATKVYKDYPAQEDHFKTAGWKQFSAVIGKYPPRIIDVNT